MPTILPPKHTFPLGMYELNENTLHTNFNLIWEYCQGNRQELLHHELLGTFSKSMQPIAITV